MSIGDTYILKQDIFSNFKVDKKINEKYGRKDEKVKIVYLSLPAVIVEGRTIFSVNQSCLIS